MNPSQIERFTKSNCCYQLSALDMQSAQFTNDLNPFKNFVKIKITFVPSKLLSFYSCFSSMERNLLTNQVRCS